MNPDPLLRLPGYYQPSKPVRLNPLGKEPPMLVVLMVLLEGDLVIKVMREVPGALVPFSGPVKMIRLIFRGQRVNMPRLQVIEKLRADAPAAKILFSKTFRQAVRCGSFYVLNQPLT